MKRRVILAAGAALLLSASAGCTHDWSVQKALGLESQSPATGPGSKDPNKAVSMPPASMAVAERVELVGRKVLSQNTFCGLDPNETLFTTAGVKEDVLFHRGGQIFISEGLVEKCKTDAELAAVLCSEMGQIIAEVKAAKAVGRDVSPIPDASFGSGPALGGTPFDAGRQVDMAYHEKRYPRGASTTGADATATARELLKGAGYSPAELDRVEGLVKQSNRGKELKKEISGSAPPPTWQK
jgi:hypothetical protein